MDANGIGIAVCLAVPVVSMITIIVMSLRAPCIDFNLECRPEAPSINQLRRRSIADNRAVMDRTEARASDVVSMLGVPQNHPAHHAAMEFAFDWLCSDGSPDDEQALRDGVEREVGFYQSSQG